MKVDHVWLIRAKVFSASFGYDHYPRLADPGLDYLHVAAEGNYGDLQDFLDGDDRT